MERASEESKADVNFILDEIDQLSKGVKIGSAWGVKFGSADTTGYQHILIGDGVVF